MSKTFGRPISAHPGALLDAARSKFVTDGYAAAHMTDIAAAAGVTKPTLYARVGPKEEVFTRTVAREAAHLSSYLLARYEEAAKRSPSEAVGLAVDALFDYCAEEPEGFLLLFSTTLGGPAIDRDGLVLTPVRQGIADLIRTFIPAPADVSHVTLGVVAAMVVEATVECARCAVIRHETDLPHARRMACAAVGTLILTRDLTLWRDDG